MAQLLHPDAFGVDLPHTIGNDYQDYLIDQTGSMIDTNQVSQAV
jgi:hypothetical protein